MSWVRTYTADGVPTYWQNSATGAISWEEPKQPTVSPWTFSEFRDPTTVALTGGGEQQQAQRAGLESQQLRDLLSSYKSTPTLYDDALAELYKTDPALAASVIGTEISRIGGVDGSMYANNNYWKSLLGGESQWGNTPGYEGLRPVWDVAKKFGLSGNPELTAAAQNWDANMSPAAQSARNDPSDGLGGVGGLIGMGIGFATGMPWLGGAIGGGLSSGNLEGALLGGALGYAGGQLFGGAGATGATDPFTGEALNSFTGDIGNWASNATGAMPANDFLGQVVNSTSTLAPNSANQMSGVGVGGGNTGILGFMEKMGFDPSTAAKVAGGLDKLGDSITKDPFKAASLAMMAGGALQNKLNPPKEETYTPTPVDRSIVDKYGKVPSLGQVNYQPLQYQGFQNLGVNQGLLNSRLNQMKGLI